jgi:hypothetical protein
MEGSHVNGRLPDGKSKRRGDARVLFDAAQEEELGRGSLDASERDPFVAPVERRSGSNSPERVHYDSTGSSNTPLDGHSFATPVLETHATPWATSPVAESSSNNNAEEVDATVKLSSSQARPRKPRLSVSRSRRSSLLQMEKRVCWALPRWLRKPLWAWLDRIALVLSPEWIRTTLLVWAMWCSLSLGE